jgi:hypothetical protein
VLFHASGDLLAVTGDGNLLGLHGALIRFAEIPTDALYVAALRDPVSHGTRRLVSMVGHSARSSRGEHHTTLSVGLAGRCAATLSGATPLVVPATRIGRFFKGDSASEVRRLRAGWDFAESVRLDAARRRIEPSTA